MDRKIFIYGLKNLGSDEFRYIGKTCRPLNRLKEHLKEKIRLFSYHKLNWIRLSQEQNIEIVFEIIEECTIYNWEEREIYWINFYKENGHRLTNLLIGGRSPQMILYKLTYDEAKIISRSLNIKTTLNWRLLSKYKKMPNELPKRPDEYYKYSGWVSWSDWLGTEIVSNKNKIFLQYEDAKNFVKKLNLGSNLEWTIYCNSGEKPNNIPSAPNIEYKNIGWINWQDWLGYDKNRKRKNNKVNYFTYDQSKSYLKDKNLKTYRDWVKFCKNDKPNEIPSNPWIFYKEWKNIKDFLNYENE